MLSVPAGRERPAGRQPSQPAHSRVPRSLGSPRLPVAGQPDAGSDRRPAERGRSLEWGRRASVDLGPPRRPLSPVKRGRPGQQPKQRQPKRMTARTLGLWALLIFISFAALVRSLAPIPLLPARGTLPLRRTLCNPLRALEGVSHWLSLRHLPPTCAVLPAASGGVNGRRERPRCRPAARPAQGAVGSQGPAGQAGVSAAAAVCCGAPDAAATPRMGSDTECGPAKQRCQHGCWHRTLEAVRACYNISYPPAAATWFAGTAGCTATR